MHMRPDDYVERRVDGYQEPQQVFLLGTCHYSSKSAQDASRLVKAINPENVVVELCRSRTAILGSGNEDSEDELVRILVSFMNTIRLISCGKKPH